MDTSSSDKMEEHSQVCPICQGAGYVYASLDPVDPDFGKAVPCKCAEKRFQDEKFGRLQRYSNLGPLTRLTFDSLIPQGRASDKENQEMFSHAVSVAKRFASSPRGWLVLEGPTGCGKTHLAAAIANYVISQGSSAFFIVVPDLLDHLRSTFSPNSEVSYDELFEQVRNAPLLIMDDLGAESSTPWAEEKLFQIINHRYNFQLPTVITLSVPDGEIVERIRNRLLDKQLCEVVVLQAKKALLLDYFGALSLPLLSSMTFDNFDYKRVNLPSEQRENLEKVYRIARSFAEQPEGWVVFQGTNGCGKTHLAAAIANYAVRMGKPVMFVIVPDFLDHLRATFSPDSRVTYDDFFEQVKQGPLLILDDFGEQSSTPWAQEKLYQLINYRYNARLPTVITTSLTLEDIESRLHSRMADPKISLVFYITAPDYRVDRRVTDKTRAIRRAKGSFTS